MTPSSLVSKIYVLKDSNGNVRYVGKTELSLSTRLNAHVSHALRGGKSPVSKWINNLHQEDTKPSIHLLEETYDWKNQEKFWIQHFDNLLNVSLGGYGGSGPKSEFTKRAISKAMKGVRRGPKSTTTPLTLVPSSHFNCGSRNGRALLEDDDVSEIKLRLLSGELTQLEIATEFGISREAVSAIKRNKRWTHIPWPTKN